MKTFSLRFFFSPENLRLRSPTPTTAARAGVSARTPGPSPFGTPPPAWDSTGKIPLKTGSEKTRKTLRGIFKFPKSVFCCTRMQVSGRGELLADGVEGLPEPGYKKAVLGKGGKVKNSKLYSQERGPLLRHLQVRRGRLPLRGPPQLRRGGPGGRGGGVQDPTSRRQLQVNTEQSLAKKNLTHSKKNTKHTSTDIVKNNNKIRR